MASIHYRDYYPFEDNVVSWEIHDFKSVGSAKVDLTKGHLSIMTGANSIGKSSLLQSMLMVCQSMGYGELVLNGPLTKLGKPVDVVRSGSDSCSVVIDFKVSDTEDGLQQVSTARTFMKPVIARKHMDTTEVLSVDSLVLDNHNGKQFEISTLKSKSDDQLKCREILRDELGFVGAEIRLLKVKPSGDKQLNRTYVAFSGLRPIAVIKLRSKKEAIEESGRELKSILESKVRRFPRSNLLAFAIQELLDSGENIGIELDESSPLDAMQNSFSRYYRSLDDDEKSSVLGKLSSVSWKKREGTLLETGRYLPYLRYQYINDDKAINNDSLQLLSELLHGLTIAYSSIAGRVEYIGPLRDDPRVVSPLTEESGQNLPIGRKGEKAASVLLSSSGRKFLFGYPTEKEPKESTLAEAINAWSKYLGVASGVQASNMQQLGVSLHVTTNGVDERDLTMVGVGASQAIPILVGVLSASPRSIVVIEQPELHLHPSAQAKLADFFLYARPDLTFLIESHSEALVTRLRRRVVEYESLSERISILFFEKLNEEDGVTTRSLSIDEYGNLEYWPKGFMDAVQEDSRFILKTGLAKRKRARDSNANR